jgi:CHAT domain-containing protein
MIGDDALLIFTISPSSFDITVANKPDSLDLLIQSLRDGITKQRYEEFVRPARTLYRTLVEPIEDKIGDADIVVVPDGAIHYVPFETLLSSDIDGSAIRNYGNLPYVIRERAVSYAYSATLLKELRERVHHATARDFLAFAPVFTTDLTSGSRTAEFYYSNAENGVRARAPYLPASLDEVRLIQRAFRRTYSLSDRLFGAKTRLMIRDQASESNVRLPAVADFRYVHFATHAFVNEANPDLSGLVLADEPSGTNDGVLHLGEVYNLDLNAELVVLSACETGYGRLATGEGLMGLTRGFLYAGASNVVVSLWKADDVATRDLMVPFYESMIASNSKAQSLRRAKLSLLDMSSRHARPYFWAQFVLMGR